MQILHGNNLELLKTLPDSSVDSIVTDPPYGLSFMNKKWDYDVPSVEFWKEAYRVLKHGGHVLSFGGTRTYHRMVVNIEDAGFEIRDQIMWLYGSGFPKSLNIGKAIDKIEGNEREVVGEKKRGDVQKAKEKGVGYLADVANRNNVKQFGYGTETITKGESEWEGWGTALKPANEPICLARKPLSEKSIAENVLKHGTGGINIDGCRVNFQNEEDRKESTAKNQHADFGTKPMTNNNVYGDYSMIEPKNYDPQGRFPANIIFDEEAGKLLDEQSGISKTGDIKPYEQRNTDSYSGSMPPIRDVNFKGDKGGASRFFYCAKASKSDRDDGLRGFHKKSSKKFDGGNFDSASTNANDRTSLNFHPTVKPTELMRYLCRLITPPNGIVLDPFMGSGSTGKGAILEGFDFIGMELDPEYVEIAKARIEYAQKEFKENQSQQKLF
jgi:site-specific DNA-methyltransferase (adenine-specific)